MSTKLVGQVWELDLPHTLAWVLMAYVDHADHEGRNIKPSLDLIRWKTGYSARQVAYATKDLIDRGLLVVDHPGGGRGNATEYHADLSHAPQKPPRIRSGNYARVAEFTETLQNDAENHAETVQGNAETNSPQAQNVRGTVNRLTINPEDEIIWEHAQDQLRLQMTRSTFDAWVRDTQLAAYDRAAHTVTVRVTNRYAVEWLTLRLRPMIRRTLASITGQPTDVVFTT